MSQALQMVVADFQGDDELTCSLFPATMFGLPDDDTLEITDEAIMAISEFNIAVESQNLVAIPSTVPGVTGIFIAKIGIELDENARAAIEMFVEPIREGILAERLHAQALIAFLDAKV